MSMKVNKQKETIENTKTRMVGIDILRLVCMFGVVVLHVIGKGGILDSSKNITSIQMVICYCVELLFLQAVDCYALISGYVAYHPAHGGAFRVDKYMNMWLQVAFHSILIPIGAYIMHLATATDVLRGLFPVSTNTYWYFSAFTGLYFLRPYLNKLVNSMTKIDIKQFTVVLLVVFSFWGGIIGRNADSLVLKNGYSVLWLVLLYIMGASLKKVEFAQKYAASRIAIVAVVCYVITLFSVVVLPVTVKKFLNIDFPRGILWSYLSPTIILMAVCTLLLFSKIKVPNDKVSRWITKLATGAFGVYLIHTNPIFQRLVLENRFTSIGNQPIYIIVNSAKKLH